MATFPIVVLPQSIKNSRQNIDNRLRKKYQGIIKELPKRPDEPNKVQFTLVFGIFLGILMGGAAFLMTKDSSIANPLFFVGFVLYVFIYLIQKSNYDSAFSKYESEVKEYNKNLNIISTENEQINIKNKILEEKLKNPIWLNEERQILINENLKPFKSADIDVINPKVGKSEVFFQSYLNNFFPNSITTNKTTELFKDFFGDEEKGYCPDFILIHKKTNLTIDIEIDEPYDSEKTPIHYRNNKHDEKRNEYFSKLNWAVIRFSERQIRLHPTECCFEIAHLIFEITQDDSIFLIFKERRRVFKERIWTSEEALELIKQDKRNKYEDFQDFHSAFTPSLIVGKWKSGYQVYEFLSDKTFIETSNITQQITDNGKYEFYDDNKIRICWSKGTTDYDLYCLDNNNVLFTDLPEKMQFIFTKHA